MHRLVRHHDLLVDGKPTAGEGAEHERSCAGDGKASSCSHFCSKSPQRAPAVVFFCETHPQCMIIAIMVIMINRTQAIYTLVALCGLAICGVSANAAEYRLTEISPAADQCPTYPAAMNATAEVAGTSGEVAFHFLNGMKENLGSLIGGKESCAYAINNLGQVVGDSTFNDSGIRHATLYVKGEATDLGTLKNGDYSMARGINDSGAIVGYAGPELISNFTQAFLFEEQIGMQDLGSLGGDYSQALAISNSRFITGNSQLVTGSNVRHAFLWDSTSGMVDLGTLANSLTGIPSNESSYGTFVNNAGHVVGYSELDETTKRVHAFLYDGTKMRDLGSLGPKASESDQSIALGVNSKDVVVGTSFQNHTGGELVQVAFIYRDGVMTNLNSLVEFPNDAPYRLRSATAINDAGQIAAQAVNEKTGELRGFLLTPNVLQSPLRVGPQSSTAARSSKR